MRRRHSFSCDGGGINAKREKKGGVTAMENHRDKINIDPSWRRKNCCGSYRGGYNNDAASDMFTAFQKMR